MSTIQQLRIMSSAVVSLALAAAALAPGVALGTEPAGRAQATRADPGAVPADAQVASNQVLDRIRLDATAITGNRELPKVMSIVPWKSAEPPAGPDRPMGSLIEEVLAPVDRDEFRREITYYRGLTSQSTSADAPPATSPAGAVTPERIRSNPSGPSGASRQ
jgi:hypothetical protein